MAERGGERQAEPPLQLVLAEPAVRVRLLDQLHGPVALPVGEVSRRAAHRLTALWYSAPAQPHLDGAACEVLGDLVGGGRQCFEQREPGGRFECRGEGATG
ncbi:hypothetical protein GCM10011574_58620 [Microbispora bryophytorum]|uniref:Uncharacterized protein n=1 Tax=Microbispora bryophytorum TaxID=1460882 RepID=A0A8H9LGH5_9ACTN|nr:hypothetical protein [Microbispora bryophytorum]GGO26369.1 hypothetical protein GCM10011574_58620 [Microbispora bryophytorum]